MNKGFGKKRVAIAAVICAFVLICAGFYRIRGEAAKTGITLSSQEGTVLLEDASGNRSEIGEDAAIESAEALVTGDGSAAVVSLDKDKTLYMDENTRVVFVQEKNSLALTVSEGRVLLDVREKLGDDETLTIATAAMDVEIRGTVVGVEDKAQEDGTKVSALSVFEGSAQASFRGVDDQQVSVPAGQRTAARYQENDGQIWIKAVSQEQNTGENQNGFFTDVLAEPVLTERVNDGTLTGGAPGAAQDAGSKPKVTFIAQSASKMYDGQPLSRPDDVMVFGLPQGYNVKATAGGSRTDAGKSLNTVKEYGIFDAQGKDVTSEFAVSLENGILVVDPATITVWTGSAEKTFDGTPLTNPEAKLLPGMSEYRSSAYEENAPDWRDSALRVEDADGQKELYGICGVTWVHGTNPLTGDTHNVDLRAGQKLVVVLAQQGGADSIEFVVKKVEEEELPEEVLRLFAKDPELMEQSCIDAGWDRQAVERLINALPEKMDAQAGEKQVLLRDCANVRLAVDANAGENAGRSLEEGVDFYSVILDESIKVTATGSQTKVGKSENTFTIDWGNANPENYYVLAKLGTLVVREKPGRSHNTSSGTSYDDDPDEEDPKKEDPKKEDPKKDDDEIKDKVTFTAASASKVYDGTPLTAKEVTAEGLPKGYKYNASCSGSRTDAGTGVNKVVSIVILDSAGKDVTSLFTNISKKDGTLKVEPLELEATWTASDSQPYDGYPYTASIGDCVLTYKNGSHKGETVDPEGQEPDDQGRMPFTLFTGDKVSVLASGQWKDAGTHDVSVKAEVTSGKAGNYSISGVDGSFTIDKADLRVETGSASKLYDGTALTCSDFTVYGLVYGESIDVTVTGSITDEGEADNTFTIVWGSTNSDNYSLTEDPGTLKVVRIYIESGSDSKVDDGTPLTDPSYEVYTVPADSMPEGWEVTDVVVTGSQEDPGSSSNTIESYTLLDDAGADVTQEYTDCGAIVCVEGTLTVKPADWVGRGITFNIDKTTMQFSTIDGTYKVLNYSIIIQWLNEHEEEYSNLSDEEFQSIAEQIMVAAGYITRV